ncbi:MAG: hypothetical protein ACLGHP_10985, partial [Vicinamibacteria bacterium]
WSGGKDSALALHELRRSPDLEVVGLLTTVAEGRGRAVTAGAVAAVREGLLVVKAARIAGRRDPGG